MLQQTIRSWIDQLLVYIGISADSARGIDQWVILAIIVAIGVGLDFLIRRDSDRKSTRLNSSHCD